VNEREQFNRLAKSYEVQTSYVDLTGRTRVASIEVLLAVLRALGASREQALRKRRAAAGMTGPRTCFGAENRKRSWGLFLPLYALWSDRNRGAGDLTDLKAFARWAGGMGAGWVSTLPLLSQFLDKPFEPSPYSPVSRLFWSEFWLDLGELKGLPRGPWVDYRRQMALKRAVLEKRAARWVLPAGWLSEHPGTLEYARFRAATEERGVWRRWPERMRRGELRAGDCSERKARVHLYAQWLVQRQMKDLRRSAAAAGTGFYFDLPLGVHPDGYDAWKEREIFVEGVNVGAPPDPFFAKGQDWGFHPIHPEKIREQGYDYWSRCLRHSMRVASLLRVDHAMGFRRLFWIPKGFPASEGVYVRYREEEWFAVLCRESRRNHCAVVGEDLGTVPAGFRRVLRDRGIAGMFVVPFELRPGSSRPLRRPPARSMAGLNTHDMPPFASFWKGWKARKPLLSQLRGEGWLRPGEGDGGPEAARALLRALAAGPARSVGVNLEDLWGERRPHNIPGRSGGRNWRRKARYSLEQFRRMERVTRVLKEMSRLRA